MRLLHSDPALALQDIGGGHVLPVAAGRIDAVTDRDDDTVTGYEAYDAAGVYVDTFDTWDDANGVLEAGAGRLAGA